jgi:pyruvate formate lyase activating enzyme
MIFNLQRFSTHDGKGIRTLIFFKGCPLRCVWCSNPESQTFGYDISFDAQKCIACRDCVKLSEHGEFSVQDGGIEIHRENIENPLLFKDLCPTKAITVVGEEKSVAEIIDEISKDLPFYRQSGGGVTLSGGEPFAQADFVHELLSALKALDIHIAVESCLHVAWEKIHPNLKLIDLFLLDLKHHDPDIFKKYTGGALGLILANLKKIEQSGAEIILRIPVIPDFNHTESAMQGILDIAASLTHVKEVHFLPYHALGSGKYQLLSTQYELPSASVAEEELQTYLDAARRKGLVACIGG